MIGVNADETLSQQWRTLNVIYLTNKVLYR